jgi:N-acetylmuramoyl-L-alanine amidase
MSDSENLNICADHNYAGDAPCSTCAAQVPPIADLTDLARFLLKLCVWREMRSVPAAWSAVAWTVINRARARTSDGRFMWWGGSIITVITHPYQYSSMTAPGNPELKYWPTDGDAAYHAISIVVDNVLAGKEPDPTGGAVLYFSEPLTEPPQQWGAVTETFAVRGVHFYRQGGAPPAAPAASTPPAA